MSKAGVDGKFRAEGRCRLCRRPGRVRPLTRHRILPGSQGGAYVPENCVPLCRPCHDLVDNRRSDDRVRARTMLRASLWPVEIARAKARGGFDFDRLYPKPPRELVLERRALALSGGEEDTRGKDGDERLDPGDERAEVDAA